MITDQRSHYRVSFFMGGDLYKVGNSLKFGRAVIRDISTSGMRVETLEPLEQGEMVYVDFEIGGRFQFEKVPATVARLYPHTGSFLLGLSFQRGEDRRHVREALVYSLGNTL